LVLFHCALLVPPVHYPRLWSKYYPAESTLCNYFTLDRSGLAQVGSGAAEISTSAKFSVCLD
ncbi:hypothetical protein AMECASPLE_011321, partial [Ameca splendens]